MIGRLESFNDDILQITERIGLKTPEIVPHHNRYEIPPPMSIWNRRLLDIVSNYYWADFDRFGYEFK